MSPLKISLFIFVLIVFLITFFVFDIGEILSFENINQHKDVLLAYVDMNLVLSAIVFSLVYFTSIALSIPVALVLSLLAGFLFGAVLGAVLIVISAVLGAAVITFLTKYFFKEYVRSWCGERVDRICSFFEKEGILYLFFIRAVPLFPFFLVNIAMGFVEISFRKYFIISLLGILPASFLFSLIGSQLVEFKEVRDVFSPTILISLCLLGIMPLIIKYIFKTIIKKKYQ